MTNTVLILGAGASAPYGFPTGAALLKSLSDLRFINLEADSSPLFMSDTTGLTARKHREHLKKCFERASFNLDHVAEMANKLMFSGRSSIDAFVASRPEYADVARFAVALFLLERENLVTLMSPATTNSWYRLLWNNLIGAATTVGELSFSNIKIGTFNYDRSLEAFLLTAIQSTFDLKPDECNELLGRIEIVHLYGSLGGVSPYTTNGLEYPHIEHLAKMYLSERALSCSQSILLMPEHRTTNASDPFSKVRSWLIRCDRLCYLGYGFDQLNDQRLGFVSALDNLHRVDQKRENLKVFASAYGGTTEWIQKSRKRAVGEQCDFKYVIEDCYATIRQFALFD